jgi:hypothetical protein
MLLVVVGLDGPHSLPQLEMIERKKDASRAGSVACAK